MPWGCLRNADAGRQDRRCLWHDWVDGGRSTRPSKQPARGGSAPAVASRSNELQSRQVARPPVNHFVLSTDQQGHRRSLMLASRVAAIAALSFISASPVAAQPAAVTVNVWSFGFAPAPIYLRAGQQVTLIFVNRSGSSHD